MVLCCDISLEGFHENTPWFGTFSGRHAVLYYDHSQDAIRELLYFSAEIYGTRLVDLL